MRSMTLTIKPNPNKELFKELTKSVVESGGACPCGIDDSVKCMCEDFIDQDTEGYCHCQRFYKEGVSS